MERSNSRLARKAWPGIERVAGLSLKRRGKVFTSFVAPSGSWQRMYHLVEPDYYMQFIPWENEHLGLWEVRRKCTDSIDFTLLAKGIGVLKSWLIFHPATPAHVEIPGSQNELELIQAFLEAESPGNNIIFYI